MAKLNVNHSYYKKPSIRRNIPVSFFSQARTRALRRIGPHNIDILSIIICGMLGDWWLRRDNIKGQVSPSIRFSIEQGIRNSAYIHHLNFLIYQLGYCSNITPILVKKSEGKLDSIPLLH